MDFRVTIEDPKIDFLGQYEVSDIEPGQKNYYIDDKLVPRESYLWYIIDTGLAVLANQYLDNIEKMRMERGE